MKRKRLKSEHKSLDGLSSGLSYVQTAIARVSGFLLMLALVVAMVNFLMDDALFLKLPWLEWFWAGAQSLAVDSNLWFVFVLLVAAWGIRDYPKVVIYSIVGVLLAFVAVIITNTEAVRQALNLTLPQAFRLTNVPILGLTWVRSIVAVLLVAVSGVSLTQLSSSIPPSSVDEVLVKLPVEKIIKPTNGNLVISQRSTSKLRYEEYMSKNPSATAKQAASDLGVSYQTVLRYRKVKEDGNATAALLVDEVGH